MTTRRNHVFHVWLVYACDALGIFLSFILAFWTRFSEVWVPVPKGVPDFEGYAKALLVVIPTYLWVFRSYGLYQLGRHVRRVEEIFILLKGMAVGAIFLMALTFFYRNFSYSRLFLVFLWVYASFIVALFRYGLIQGFYALRRHSRDIKRVLVVGTNRNARGIIQWIRQNPHFGYRVEGVLAQEEGLIGKHFEEVPVVGTIEQCALWVKEKKPDEVIVADAGLPKEKVANLLLQCENGLVSFKVAADLYGIVTSNLDIEYLASVPLLGLRSLPLDDPWNRAIKRMLDIFCSAGLLLLTAPLGVLSAVFIQMTDKGPFLFKQERVGQDGKQFFLYKFRTMHPDAEKETGPIWTQKGDPRTTAVGKILRRFNLDELPQLWNVLRGEMSLVGPRPERPHFVDQFRDEIPRYMTRHKIKSGITGWAQVNGLRGNTSLQERIKYDLYYAENWSFLFDLEILFMTLFAFKNAY